MPNTKLRTSAQLIVDADFDHNAKKITNLATPTNPADAATKSYVDGILDVLNGVQYKGVLDCSTNPNYPAASAGHLYVISVGGKIGGVSGHTVAAADIILCKTDSTATGDEATVGAQWDVVDHGSGGTGDVVGPASSTDHAVARFDLATGKLLQNSLVTIDDTGSINIPTGQTYKINGTSLAKADVGLGNVDNTADVNKAVLSATKLATARAINGVNFDGQAAITIYDSTKLASSNIVFMETPTGTKNGINATFTLANTPVSGKLMLILDGSTLNPGAGNDFTITGNTITMLGTAIPASSSILLAFYIY